MNRTLQILLAGCALSWIISESHAANYIVDAGASNLGYETLELFGTGLNENFDNVLFTARVTGATPLTKLDLALAADGAGPGNYAILSGATYLPGSGVAPTTIQLNQLNAAVGAFQCTFTFASPPLSMGMTTATLVLEYPLNSIAPLVPNTPFVLCWANNGVSSSAATISA